MTSVSEYARSCVVANTHLHQLTMEGIDRLYGRSGERRDRAAAAAHEELASIRLGEAASSILLARECRRVADTLDMPTTPGWHLTAGSLVAYALGISDLDPLAFDLVAPDLFDCMICPCPHWHFALPICDDDDGDLARAVAQFFGSMHLTCTCESADADRKCTRNVDIDAAKSRANGQVYQVFVPMPDLSIQRNTLRTLKRSGKTVPVLSDISLEDAQTFDVIAHGGNCDLPFFDQPDIRTLLDVVAPRSIETLTIVVAQHLANRTQLSAVAQDQDESLPMYKIFTNRTRRAYAMPRFHRQCDLLSRAPQGHILATLELLDESINRLTSLTKTRHIAFTMPQAFGLAVIAYRTAFLKAHFPGEYMAVITEVRKTRNGPVFARERQTP